MLELDAEIIRLACTRETSPTISLVVGPVLDLGCEDLIQGDKWKECDPVSRNREVVSVDREAILKRLTQVKATPVAPIEVAKEEVEVKDAKKTPKKR